MSHWHYYNHALLPNCPPPRENLEEAIFAELSDRQLWNENGNKALLARWTTNFDCGYETNWWYCIKDESYNIDSVKSKIRYYVKKGISNFEVRVIRADDYREDLYMVAVAAFSAYPESYRPTVDKEKFENEISEWDSKYVVFGAFDRENGTLQGYSLCGEHVGYVELCVLKTNPDYEKMQINAALVNGILEHYNDRLSKEFYIVDGERNILHETAFQNYLEKYFGFRKAYCKLHIQYRRGVGVIVKILLPFRKLIAKSKGRLCKKIAAVLKMETLSE